MSTPALRFPATAIRSVIRDVLEGTAGTTSPRKLEHGVFKYGTHEDQELAAQQATSLQADVGRHWFGVRLYRVTRNTGSQFSALGSYRVANVQIAVDVTTHAPSAVEEEARDEVLGQVVEDLEAACAALAFPGVVETNAAGDETGIIEGGLIGANGGGELEYEVRTDWPAQLIRSRIDAVAIVQIAQEV